MPRHRHINRHHGGWVLRGQTDLRDGASHMRDVYRHLNSLSQVSIERGASPDEVLAAKRIIGRLRLRAPDWRPGAQSSEPSQTMPAVDWEFWRKAWKCERRWAAWEISAKFGLAVYAVALPLVFWFSGDHAAANEQTAAAAQNTLVLWPALAAIPVTCLALLLFAMWDRRRCGASEIGGVLFPFLCRARAKTSISDPPSSIGQVIEQ